MNWTAKYHILTGEEISVMLLGYEDGSVELTIGGHPATPEELRECIDDLEVTINELKSAYELVQKSRHSDS